MKQAKFRKGKWQFRCFCGTPVSFQKIECVPQCPQCKTEYDVFVGVDEKAKPRIIKAVFVDEKAA